MDNRQLIATVLLLFFAIKTVLPKSQNTKTFGNEETFGNKINEERNIQSQSNLQMRIFQKISLVKLQGAQQATYCNCFTTIFCNKNSFAKISKHKNFRNKETFGNKKYEDGNIQKQSNCKCLFVKK